MGQRSGKISLGLACRRLPQEKHQRQKISNWQGDQKRREKGSKKWGRAEANGVQKREKRRRKCERKAGRKRQREKKNARESGVERKEEWMKSVFLSPLYCSSFCGPFPLTYYSFSSSSSSSPSTLFAAQLNPNQPHPTLTLSYAPTCRMCSCANDVTHSKASL